MKALKTIYPLLIAALVLARCNCSPTVAGNGSQTPNSVVGILYQPDGKTPAKGVRVHIRPQKTLADTTGAGLPKRLAVLAAVDSVVTDNTGRYAFDTTIDTGTFVIEAASGNNAVLIDSVAVKNKAVTDSIAPDTLKPAGALKGVIYLSEGGDPRKVFVLAFGIDRFAKVNVDGSFKFSGLAEAKYDLRLISGLDNYGVLDTTAILVRSADTTNLDTLKLPFTGIPTPKNVKISYDTLKQIVTVTWDSADANLVSSYNIYRRNVGLNTVPARINATPVTSSVYKDSSGVQDSVYGYQVLAVDKNGTEGIKSVSLSQKITSAFLLLDTINTPWINSSQAHAFIIGKDSTIYIAAAGANNFVRVLSKNGDTIAAIGEGHFSQVFDMALDSKGNLFVVDPDSSKIFKFLKNGQVVSGWQLNIPTGIAIDTQDNVYAVFSYRRGIMKFDSSGKKMDSVFFSTTINAMEGNLVIGSNGNLFVGDLTDNKIFTYSSNLAIVNSFTLTRDNHTLTELHAIDDKGNLYIRNVRNTQPDLEYDVFTSTGDFVAKLQPGVGDYLRILGNRLYLMSQTGLLIYRIPL